MMSDSEPELAQELWEVLLEEHVHLGRQDGDHSAKFQALRRGILAKTQSGSDSERARNRLAWVYQEIHAGPAKSALCLSGGGVRSATYNLGLIQGLARAGFLSKFDYLSTVSGGGYIGSWLSAWIHRKPGGVVEVERDLREGCRPNPANCGASSPHLQIEPNEVTHLREYSNYLTPRLGWLSGDTWALLATYPRNLLLNWLVVVPLVLSAMCFIWLGVAGASYIPPASYTDTSSLAMRMLRGGLAVYLIGICLATPLAPVLTKRKGTASDSPMRKWWRHRRPLALVVLPIYGGSIISAVAVPALTYESGTVDSWKLFRNVILAMVIVSQAMAAITFGVIWVKDRGRRITGCATLANYIRIAGIYLVATLFAVSCFFLVHQKVMPAPESHALLTLWLEPVIRLMLACILFTVIVGLTSESQSPDMEETREWWSRLMGYLLLLTCAHFVIVGLVCISPALVEYLRTSDYSVINLSIAGAISTGSAIYALVVGRSADTAALKEPNSGVSQGFVAKIPGTAAVIALGSLVVLTSWAFTKLLSSTQIWPAIDVIMRTDPLHTSYKMLRDANVAGAVDSFPNLPPYSRLEVAELAGVLVGLIVFAMLWAYPINVNRFSLHGTYRMRLVRAYLGASRGEERRPNAFTGFDGKDNVPLHFLRRTHQISAADIPRQRLLARLIYKETGEFWEFLRSDTKPCLGDATRHAQLGIMASTNGDLTSSEKTLLKDMVDALNNLLDEPDLFAKAYGGVRKLTDEQWNAIPKAILDAYEQALNDGSPRLCNRLILEHKLRDSLGTITLSTRIARPLHVINAALNLVGGQRLAWQQRKARSFTFTPLTSGFDLGYRPTVQYSRGMTLGGAMTVSGAAASPNMGYHSSPAVTALMTLFNVRLGCWLGNPTTRSQVLHAALYRVLGRVCPEPSYRLMSPRLSIRPLVDEAFGRTTGDNGYVYLSDGGHFENLGLYEMVRRRCKLIIVSDASCDASRNLDDLGNAVRKIRIDLGVPIRLRRVNFQLKDASDLSVRCCTVGQVQYDEIDGSDAEEGLLIYFKPALTGKEPVDVFHYSRESADFPHEPTTDQWFTESQFESYRRLGQSAAEAVLGAARAAENATDECSVFDIERLRRIVEAYIGPDRGFQHTSKPEPVFRKESRVKTDQDELPTLRDGEHIDDGSRYTTDFDKPASVLRSNV